MYVCGSVRNLDANGDTLTCTTSAGVGTNLRFTGSLSLALGSMGFTMIRCAVVVSGVQSAQGADVYQYALPTISPVSYSVLVVLAAC